MTRKTTTPHRTKPLDRDGDGHNGGSLAGNQTAPMADEAPEAGIEPADRPVNSEEEADTFTAEEIAAGARPVAEQEGEAEVTAADVATVIPEEDPLVTIDTDTAAIAGRLGNLRRLADNRWLYKTAEGYSPTYHAPFVPQDEVDIWIKAGLARYDATAGRIGGVQVDPTAQARIRAELRDAA